jgi:drug/metabolite transporter (DMT)-like permease
MDFMYLFTSILAESVAKTIDKLNYHRNRITPRVMMFLVFLVMTISITTYIVITRQSVPHISPRVVLLLLGVGAFSFGGNVFDELSLKADDLSLREPLVDFEPILAGLVGYAVFPSQRKTAFLIAFILGGFIVRWGIHRRKLRKGQKKGMFYLLIGVMLYAILPSLYQETLHYISPSYLAFFRVTAILVLTSIFFPPKKWKGFTTKRVSYVIAAGIIYAIGAIASLYAIRIYGVVLTMLFLMLGPALRYLAGQFILHEKVRRGEVLSSLMLTLVVALAAFVR